MKKVSDELNRLSKISLMMFVLSFIVVFVATIHHFHLATMHDISTVERFVEYEVGEMARKSTSFNQYFTDETAIPYIMEEIIHEAPKIHDIIIITRSGDEFLATEEDSEELEYLDHLDNIYRRARYIDSLKYAMFHKIYTIHTGSKLSVKIIKDLSSTRRDIFSMFCLLIGILGIFLCISRFFINRSYKSIVNSIKVLQNETNKVNLDSIEKKRIKPTRNKYQEFNAISVAYSQMLDRLATQVQNQIDFVNNTSHELKTPVFVIEGNVDLLTRWGKDDPKILAESLASIKDECVYMNNLIRDLLFLAKEHSMRVSPELLDLNAIISQIIKEEHQLQPSQEFVYTPTNIKIESDKLITTTIIKNIINNAVKYGNNKPISIKVAEYIDSMLIVIADQGKGIAKENMDRIFDRFYMEDTSRTRSKKSHGLGLSIVKQGLTLLHGDINIESEVDHGTTVTITLPLKYVI